MPTPTIFVSGKENWPIFRDILVEKRTMLRNFLRKTNQLRAPYPWCLNMGIPPAQIYGTHCLFISIFAQWHHHLDFNDSLLALAPNWIVITEVVLIFGQGSLSTHHAYGSIGLLLWQSLTHCHLYKNCNSRSQILYTLNNHCKMWILDKHNGTNCLSNFYAMTSSLTKSYNDLLNLLAALGLNCFVKINCHYRCGFDLWPVWQPLGHLNLCFTVLQNIRS